MRKDNGRIHVNILWEMGGAETVLKGILEKSKNINAIKLNIPWSDLGSWKEICKIYNKLKNKLEFLTQRRRVCYSYLR